MGIVPHCYSLCESPLNVQYADSNKVRQVLLKGICFRGNAIV